MLCGTIFQYISIEYSIPRRNMTTRQPKSHSARRLGNFERRILLTRSPWMHGMHHEIHEKSMRNLWEIYEKSIWHYENFMRNLWEIYMTLWEYVRVEWNGRFIRQHNNLSCELSWIICYIRYIHQCNMHWARLCIQDSYGFILQSDLGL
jgi:hypothetical protein